MWSAYRHGLNVTKLHCYNVTMLQQIVPALPAIDEK